MTVTKWVLDFAVLGLGFALVSMGVSAIVDAYVNIGLFNKGI